MINERLLPQPEQTAQAANTFASENFNTVLYTGNGGTQRIGGYINRGAVFNGSSSKVIASGIAQPTGDVSVSMWIKFDSIPSGQKEFFDWVGNSSVPTIRINTYDSDDLRFNIGNGYRYISSDSLTITTNTWYYLAASLDRSANAATLYLNGSPLGATITITGTSSDTQGLYIGCNVDENRFTDGTIDQIRLFDKAISSSEVTTLYEETHASTTKSTTDIFEDGSAIALYQLDGNANDTGGVSGKYGSAAHFNGSTSQITFDDLPTSSTMSVSFWMKTSSTISGYQMILELGNGYAINRPSSASSGKIYAQYANSNSSHKSNSDTLPVGTYFHVVGVFTSSSATLYINNVNQTGGTITDYLTADQNTIGSRRADGFFTGQIDDVRIYSDALTADEVGYLYNNTTASIPTDNLEAHYKFDGDARDETVPSFDGTATNVKYAYDGTASNVTYQEATKFQPDLVWIKSRTQSSSNHVIYDSIRTAGEYILPNTAGVEGTITNGLTSFDSNGFTVGSEVGHNNSGSNYVAWCWNAADTTTTIAANSVGNTIASDVRANTDAGFSIVTYSGNSASSATIGHGLNSAPELIITKARNLGAGWPTMAKLSSGSLYGLRLNSSGANDTGNGSIFYNNTDPTDSVYTVGGSDEVNDGYNYISYCFHSVDGYQKIGSYTGTQSSNVVETGFEPAFLLIKNTSSADGNWMLIDNKRSTTNPRTKKLTANTTGTENDSSYAGGESAHNINFLSDGFELLETGSGKNTNFNGHTYIYLAIAADPDETTPTLENSFDVVTYTANGSSQSIEADFKPDLVWFKERNGTNSHQLYDSIRGDHFGIFTNTTDAQYNYSTHPNGDLAPTFTSTGFNTPIATNNGINRNNGDYVAWCWKAGDHDDNLPEINTNGTIDSTVSVNDAAGFSIVKYTGNLSGATTATGQSVGHGLSSPPELIIFKSISNTGSWDIFSSELDNWSTRLQFDAVAKNNLYSSYPIADPTSEVFYTNYLSAVNVSGYTYIAYCWYSVPGYSKIGSYTGSSYTVTVTTDFRPRFIMIKRSNGSNDWIMYDSQRSGNDTNFNDYLTPNRSYGEYVNNSIEVNTTLTGFTVASGMWSGINALGGEYIYMAFK